MKWKMTMDTRTVHITEEEMILNRRRNRKEEQSSPVESVNEGRSNASK